MSLRILTIDRVSKAYTVRKSLLRTERVAALDDVSVALQRGQTLAVIGESGSGKSTLAKLVMRLDTPSSGVIRLAHNGVLTDIAAISPRDLYRRVQMVFQDPWSSLNPRNRIWQIVSAPCANQANRKRDELRAIAERQLKVVGLGSHLLDALPAALSGGQRQRVGIARALSAEPDVLILDEPLSALDVSVQSQILNLLLDLQRSLGLTYLFISHDLGVVRHIADMVAVMYRGCIVEYGAAREVIGAPAHPYTKMLVNSIPGHGQRISCRPVRGELIAVDHNPGGCSFVSRCPEAVLSCQTQRYSWSEVAQRRVACLHARNHPTHERIDAT